MFTKATQLCTYFFLLCNLLELLRLQLPPLLLHLLYLPKLLVQPLDLLCNGIRTVVCLWLGRTACWLLKRCCSEVCRSRRTRMVSKLNANRTTLLEATRCKGEDYGD